MVTSLNPNAPMFVPSAYRAVEDFSDQWWDLVQSSPCFRDYWLRECFSDPQIDSHFADSLAGNFILSGDGNGMENHHNSVKGSSAKGKEEGLDLVPLGWLKWKKPRGVAQVMPRHCCEKAPKIVNMRVIPRPIQQPR